MRILILDDNPERVAAYFKCFSGWGITFCNIPEAATSCFEGSVMCNQKYDLIVVDHDLAGNFNSPIDAKLSGAEFIRWLTHWLQTHLGSRYIGNILHGRNKPANSEMLRLLKTAVIPAEVREFSIEMVKELYQDFNNEIISE